MLVATSLVLTALACLIGTVKSMKLDIIIKPVDGEPKDLVGPEPTMQGVKRYKQLLISNHSETGPGTSPLRKMGSQKSTTTFDKKSENLTDLTIGMPGDDILAKSKEIIRRGTESRLSMPGDTALFNYGPGEGPPSFLSNMSKLLSKGYKDDVPADELMLTSGASAGLFFALSVLADKNSIAFVESPTYFIAGHVIKDLGVGPDRLVPIPMTPGGLDIDYLEAQLKAKQPKDGSSLGVDPGRYWAFLYTISTYHNPTGVSLGAARAKKLVELSRKFNFLIVCDDVYNLLSYDSDGQAPKRVLTYDKEMKGNRTVISNGSFSKILAPGIRLGWIETSPKIKARLVGSGVVDSGGGLNAVAAGFIASAMEMGLIQRHVDYLKETYKERMNELVKILREGLPESFEVDNPQGGYFIWVTGPDNFDSRKFADLCESQYGVAFLSGEKCSVLKDEGIQAPNASSEEIASMQSRNSFRLSIGFYQKQVLSKAARKIVQAAQRFMSDPGQDKD